MAFENRIVEHPGRVVLTPVTGQTNTYDADYVSQQGTVSQEGTMMEASAMNAAVQDLIDSSMNGITISPAGTVTMNNIQIGIVSVTPTAANTITSKSFTFASEFENTPVVMLLPRSRVPDQVTHWSIHDISTTGFTVYMTRTNTTQTNFMYLAVGV